MTPALSHSPQLKSMCLEGFSIEDLNKAEENGSKEVGCGGIGILCKGMYPTLLCPKCEAFVYPHPNFCHIHYY